MGMGTARLPKSPSHYYVTTYYVGTLTILLWTNNYPVLYLTEWNKRSGTLLLLHVPTYSPVLQHLRGKSASLLITRFTNATALHCTCSTADPGSVAIRGRESLVPKRAPVPRYPTASHSLDTTASLHVSGSVSPNNVGSE
jgi:hypothetical protein